MCSRTSATWRDCRSFQYFTKQQSWHRQLSAIYQSFRDFIHSHRTPGQSPRRISSSRNRQDLLSSFGQGIDILVSNIGCELITSAKDITPEDISYAYDLNVRATILMTKAVIPRLRSSGRIINIGSVGGRSGFKDVSLCCSSKAAVESLTRCFAAELGAQGHTFNTVCPGPMPTDVLKGIPDEIIENQMKNTPMENRLGSTVDLAQTEGWLAEEGSRWVTGQAVRASGGNMKY